MNIKSVIAVIIMLFATVPVAVDAAPVFTVKDGIADGEVKSRMELAVNDMFETFNMCNARKKGSVKLNEKYFDEYSRQMVAKMWKTSRMCIPDGNYSASCLNLPTSGYQVRGIPVVMTDDSIAAENRNQELTIDFDPTGRVKNVKISIPLHNYKDIIAQGKTPKDLRYREMVLGFVEQFRTAYNEKNLPFIESVFSEQALIIVGTVLKPKYGKMRDLKDLRTKEKIKYTRYSKQQYMDNLRRCFKRNKWLDIKFSDIEVIQDRRYNYIYGVRLKQDWSGSGGYHDEGWVFLIIDFQKEEEPVIYVRTWQPYRDYDTKQVIKYGDNNSSDKLFNNYDFRL